MLKVGVIGVGSMGKNHARVCSEIDDIELVGVADTNKGVAKKIAERFSTKAFYDYRELIPLIDAAIVSTPTVTHYSIAQDLLKSGKNVLVEKPMCEDSKKADSLLKIAQREGLILAVGHIERYNPAVKFVKTQLEKKSFGEIITLSSKRVSNFPGRIRDVGVILDFGIHDIDVMRYLVGEIRSVYAKSGKVNRNIDFEDHAIMILNFENGVAGFVEVNWLTPMKVRKLSLTCSRVFAEVDYIEQTVTISSSKFGEIDETDLYHIPLQYHIDKISLEKKEPLKEEIKDFVEAIEKGKKPLADGFDGLMALKVAEAAVRSCEKGREEIILYN